MPCSPALPTRSPDSKPAHVEPVAPTDEDLIKSSLAGDDGSFAELVRRHKRKVFGMAARFAHDAHQLDDIAQEAFIRVYRNLGKFRGDAPFEHWLSRIAVSACYDFLRKSRRSREHVPLENAEGETAPEPKHDADHARQLLAFAMSKLSPEERLVITLTELEEKPVREVAALTGWSKSNVKVRAFRARQALKRILEATREV
jgi:RNA polymerase sigma-70 factor, ECF subfamily